MNILLLVKSLGIGGTERVVQVFAEKIIRKGGYNVCIGTNDPFGPRSEFIRNLGVEIIDIKKHSAKEIVKKYDINVVFGHSYSTKDFLDFENIIKTQEVIFCGSLEEEADINFVISNTLAYKIKLINPEAKVLVLYNPQNLEGWSFDYKRNNILREFGINNEKFVVSRIARPEPSKWDYIFIPSVKGLLKRYKNFHMILVGTPLLYRIFLWKYRKSILYIKPTSDDKFISKIYAGSDVFFHTAEKGETFGIVIAEAMYHGKPIITHSTNFISKKGDIIKDVDNAQIELVTHGENGFVITNPEDFAKYILMLKNDKKLYEKISKNNIDKVKKYYDAEIVINQFLDAIRDFTKKTIKYNSLEYFKEKYEKCFTFPIRKTTFKYKIYRFTFNVIKFIYLVLRMLLRKIKIDIENI